MKLFRNRIVLGVICIVLSLIICFVVTPFFNKSISNKTEIVRVAREIQKGDEIAADMLQTVEVGAYNLPETVVRSVEEVVGKYATADLLPGDYILSSKVEREPSAENEYLYHLNGEKQAISITPKSFAAGLSGKLQSGDIVSVIAPDYQMQGVTVIPPELQYVEVIAVTSDNGADANTGEKVEDGEERELPDTVTLLATPDQAKILAELEAESGMHLTLVFRGGAEQAAKFIEAQDSLLKESYAETGENTESGQATEAEQDRIAKKGEVIKCSS